MLSGFELYPRWVSLTKATATKRVPTAAKITSRLRPVNQRLTNGVYKTIFSFRAFRTPVDLFLLATQFLKTDLVGAVQTLIFSRAEPETHQGLKRVTRVQCS